MKNISKEISTIVFQFPFIIQVVAATTTVKKTSSINLIKWRKNKERRYWNYKKRNKQKNPHGCILRT